MKELFEFFSRTYKGSNFISFKLRKLIEGVNLRKVLGLQLASSMFLAAVIIPGISNLLGILSASSVRVTPVLAFETTTKPSYIWPLDEYQLSQGYSGFHPGIDLSAPMEYPVKAINDGIVESIIVTNWGYGRHIIVRHDSGYVSLYAHLSKELVTSGESVSQGQVIGMVGVSGWSTGSHLHLEVRTYQGESINPVEILSAAKVLVNK